MLRKSPLRGWDEKLVSSTQQVNFQVIQYFQVVLWAIFFGAQAILGSLDRELAFIPTQSIDAWVDKITDPAMYFTAVRKYQDYRMQVHNWVRQLTSERKKREIARYNAGVNRMSYEVGLLVMVYLKKTAKLKPWWRDPFQIVGLGRTWDVS